MTLGLRLMSGRPHNTPRHYGPNGELLYERDANGNTRVYVWLEGRPLARIDNDAQIYYYHVDHLGTPQAMTNAAGTTVWKADYEPFGKATVRVNTVENYLRFPGQYYDRETGLSLGLLKSLRARSTSARITQPST
ncbi:MAG: RHS domain-containing protein [Gammaproteobacteria bacterium]|nr:RHS domain-containing protein [Gammaproteobacteria bacterium]MBU1408855.1 RHS domain-containing protein [Gammaproteobacteria bacterium]MBU1532692.1 RHS domain-containing protein [Gammaproteobacteria bacterium]